MSLISLGDYDCTFPLPSIETWVALLQQAGVQPLVDLLIKKFESSFKQEAAATIRAHQAQGSQFR